MAGSKVMVVGEMQTMGVDWFVGRGLIADLMAQVDSPGVVASFMGTVWIWVLGVLGIGLVIFVHELGHFLAAKWCGVKVEKFYVGFDVPISIGPIKLPRTLGKFRHGETEYGIGTIPLGGYVKMLGQDDDPRKAEAEAKRIRQINGDQDDGVDDDAPVVVKLDPRSFPAKPVWQRMIIISSGVVMNLITGVLFAAVAFLVGVPYTPAIVGDVTPGGPAYVAGIQPGGKVVGVGKIDRDDQLHFREMKMAILTEGMDHPDQPVTISIEYPDGIHEYQLQTVAMAEEPSQRLIGISMPSSTRLGKRFYADPGSTAAGVLTSSDAEAIVIAFDGNPVPGAEDESVEGSVALQKYLQQNATQPIGLKLKRKDESIVDVVIPPQRLKLPGVDFEVGPVVALVAGGPAERAGVKIGDVLVAVDGQANVGPLALPTLLAKSTSSKVMAFRRGQGDAAEAVELTLEPSEATRSTSPISPTDNTIVLDRFGIAYSLLPVIRGSVDPSTPSDLQASDASDPAPMPMDSNRPQAGDVLKKVTVRWPGDAVPEFLDADEYAMIRKRLTEGWELSDVYPLSALVRVLQNLPEGTPLDLVVSRAGRIVETQTVLTATDAYWSDRGIGFSGVERLHRADGLGDALALGFREGQRRLGDVFRFLSMLVQGKVESKQVGGPITIFRVAGAESTRGIPSLLMFLTMLSMNLAILNFLPIPALDGGHMVFLTAEAVLGRPVDEKLQMQLTMVGVLALLSLMALAFFNDIRRL